MSKNRDSNASAGTNVFLSTLVILIAAVMVSAQISTQDMEVAQRFELGTHPFGARQMEYRYFVPREITPQRTYPLVITLHGAGDYQNSWSIITNHPLAVIWARDSTQQTDPCFVVSPGSFGQWVNTPWSEGSYTLDNVPISMSLACVIDILDSLLEVWPIDTNRIYVTGLSMGGFGTWDLAMRFPRRFAAIAPMCGGGDPSKAALLSNIGIWTTHGTTDGIIPVVSTREMVAALAAAEQTILYTHCTPGGACLSPNTAQQASLLLAGPDVIYAEYLNMGHVEAWRGNERGYDNPLLVRWILSHVREQKTAATQTGSASRQPRAGHASVRFVTGGAQIEWAHTTSKELFLIDGRSFSREKGSSTHGIAVVRREP